MAYGSDIDFDPMTALMEIDAPILWILGEKDPETPLQETLATIQRLRKSGKNVTVKLFPGADHQIKLPRTSQSRPNYAPGYIEGTIQWVRDHCGEKPA